MFYVYELRDPDGVPFYIGKGSKRRMHAHRSKAKAGNLAHVYCKIRKLWRRGLDYTAEVVFTSRDEGKAFAEEIRLIALYGRKALTNKTDGGDGVRNLCADGRERIAASRRGKVASVETRERQRRAALGRVVSAATREKIAASSKGTKKPWARAVALRNLPKMSGVGRLWTEEHRQKFRAARLGHPVSQETRDKISASKRALNARRRQIGRLPKRERAWGVCCYQSSKVRNSIQSKTS